MLLAGEMLWLTAIICDGADKERYQFHGADVLKYECIWFDMYIHSIFHSALPK